MDRGVLLAEGGCINRDSCGRGGGTLKTQIYKRRAKVAVVGLKAYLKGMSG